MSRPALATTLILASLIAVVHAENSKTCAISDIKKNGTLIEDCDVLCKPAAWTDLIIFYIGNYFSHVATIRTEPGQAWQDSMLVAVNALFFPSTGLLAAVKAIKTGAVFARTPLQTAARAEALYMLAKVPERDQRPRDRRTPRRRRSVNGRTSTEDDTNARQQDDGHLQPQPQPQPQHDDTPAPVNGVVAETEKHDVATKMDRQEDNSPHHLDGQTEGVEVSHEKDGEPSGDDETNSTRRSLRENDLERGPSFDNMLPTNTIHGRLVLPAGYTLERVPAFATFEGEGEEPFGLRSFLVSLFRNPRGQPEHMTELAQDYSFLKAAVALGQALYAISTLYETRGAQIQQFGYVAYGFTVLPYAFMSTINLVSNVICPEYSAIFLVENEELRQLRQLLEDENRSSELVFEGSVGTLSTTTEQRMRSPEVQGMKQSATAVIIWQIAMILGGLAVYLAVVGGLTGFSKGHSTHAQRAWIMTWYCFGVVLGPYIKFYLSGVIIPISMGEGFERTSINISFVLTILIYATPAIGGLVVVGQEIKQYGVCESI